MKQEKGKKVLNLEMIDGQGFDWLTAPEEEIERMLGQFPESIRGGIREVVTAEREKATADLVKKEKKEE